jgi:hypothetical protein
MQSETGLSIAGITAAPVVTAGWNNGKLRRSRPVGYAPWNPRGETLVMVERIDSVLNDHVEYWPITPRQVVYRLWAAARRSSKTLNGSGST